MKRHHLLLSSFALFAFLLVSCNSNGGKNNAPAIEELFTITWKNYDGTILETDKNIKKGVIPTYDGTTPTKPSDSQFTYTFKGWDPEITEVTKDQFYIAIYSSEKIKEETYTITRKNYDGTILETDKDVKKGTIPTYDGTTPTKPSDTEFAFTFKGWDPEITEVSKDQIYTATFTSEKLITEEERYATKPIISSNGKTIKYGLYPQTNVNDETLISTLNTLTTTLSNGWYLYDNEYYAKVEAKPYKTTYFFDNGTPIIKGQTYWFKCEPIVWKILNKNSNEYFILSDVLLDAHCFHSSTEDRTIDEKTIYANNYKYSDIRTWLNDDFYNSAFALGNAHIKLTTVDNSINTIKGDDPKFICENTEDKVYLPSYKDYLTPSYGFKEKELTSLSRYCQTTDWSRARGSLSSNVGEQYPNNGYYLTRSPNNASLGSIWGPNTGGAMIELRIYDKDSSVRPSISIKIS